MRQTPILIALALAAMTGSAGAAPPAETQGVTLSFIRYYDQACRCYKARLSGRIASGAANEDVAVLRQYCGRSFSTAVAGARTREGGFWETELPIVVSRPDALVSESYRARWNGQLSEPVTFRGHLVVSHRKLSRKRHRVTAFTSVNNPVDLRGRTILLQRQIEERWRRIATARLTPAPVKYYTFVATFTVPRRGWRLRAFVPAKSAAPCFTASASEPWTS
ncbi:MAG: hypothetical protein ACRDNY_10430 [Gaiellaceae bacterium]